MTIRTSYKHTETRVRILSQVKFRTLAMNPNKPDAIHYNFLYMNSDYPMKTGWFFRKAGSFYANCASEDYRAFEDIWHDIENGRRK